MKRRKPITPTGLRAIRKALKISQADIARISHLSTMTVGRFEEGITETSKNTIEKLTKALERILDNPTHRAKVRAAQKANKASKDMTGSPLLDTFLYVKICHETPTPTVTLGGKLVERLVAWFEGHREMRKWK